MNRRGFFKAAGALAAVPAVSAAEKLPEFPSYPTPINSVGGYADTPKPMSPLEQLNSLKERLINNDAGDWGYNYHSNRDRHPYRLKSVSDAARELIITRLEIKRRREERRSSLEEEIRRLVENNNWLIKHLT